MKVTDRRMFTADGRLREEFEALDSPPTDAHADAEEAAPSPVATVLEARADPEPAVPPGREEPARVPLEIPDLGPGGAYGPPGFLDLVSILAEPIALYLGDLSLPDGQSAENLEMARLHIDLLAVLRQKTAGNLVSQEAAVLEDLLYRSRLRYVQKRG